MRALLTKTLWLVATILFGALAARAYLGVLVHISPDSAATMAFIVSGSIPIAYLLHKEGPLPSLVDNIWVGASTLTLFTLMDTILRLGYLKHGLLTFLPIHLFTLYVWRVIQREGEVDQQQSYLILMLAIAALFLSAFFNFG